MPTIDRIRASDGSGNASVATVQNSRSSGSSTIHVDTVDNINATFMGSMGTPHTFVDPITSEEITVISEATCVDFAGHVNGANLEIDTIAPGQTDLGSAVNDIVIIRPTTQWGDNVADVLGVAHNDNGSAKDLSIDYNALTLNLKQGWISAAETWTFTSFSATTGVIAVPTGAANRYSLGMKIRISQSTGGTKYGFITKIADTALTIYFGTDYTLNNETISSPYYSTQKAPYGFPLNPAKWTVTATSSSDRTTSSATYASLTDTAAIPIGAWDLKFKGHAIILTDASTTSRHGFVTLSSDGSTETHPQLTAAVTCKSPSAATANSGATFSTSTLVALTAATTFTVLGKTTTGTTTLAGSTDTPTVIRAICAYL